MWAYLVPILLVDFDEASVGLVDGDDEIAGLLAGAAQIGYYLQALASQV